MKLPPEDLRKLAELLDRAIDMPVAEREQWLDTLEGDGARLAPSLREMLARRVSQETADLLDRLPPGVAVFANDAAMTSDHHTAGDVVNHYRLLRQIGSGGMGAVWLAERSDGAYRRQVALKLPHAIARAGLRERFARERDILASLEHPNIARLYDAGVDHHGSPYLAMEFVDGVPIDVYCREQDLGINARLRLLLQVARAVAHAHARLVVHRDLKPSNILVSADGQVRLLDFGIAKLLESESAIETQLTRVAGRALTPDYASPEQIQGASIGTPSDVYSLGVVAYRLLTGSKPYRLKRGSAAELEEAILAAEPAVASQAATDKSARRALKGDLDAILMHALRKAPADRYSSADAFAQDIERYLRGEPVQARPDSAAYRLGKFVVRNKIAVGAASMVIVAIIVGAATALWQASVARDQAVVAREQAERAQKEAQRAQAVQGFMIDLFRTNSHQQADPLKAQQTTARELLDIGAARVNEALKSAPESQMQVLNTLSDMYVQLGLSQQSLDLQRQSVDVARKTHGIKDAMRADALLSYVAVLHESPRRHEIPPLLAESRAALDAAGETTTFLRGALLMETARYYRYEALSQGTKTADAAVEFFQKHHPERASLVTSLRLAGIARLQARNFMDAETRFRAAIEAADKRGMGAPAWRVGALADLGEAEQAQMHFVAAETSYRQALADTLKVNGPTHPESLLTQLKVANVLVQTGRTAEGLAMHAAVRAAIEREPGRYRDNWRSTAADLLGATLTARGRPSEVARLVEPDVANLRATLPNSGVRIRRELQLAEAWTAIERFAEAGAIIDAMRDAWVSYAGAEANAAAMNPITLLRVRWLRIQRRSAEALALLDVGYVAEGAATLDQLRAGIERAHALRMEGSAAPAADVARSVLAQLHVIAPEHALPQLEAEALLALGQAELAAGAAEVAEAPLGRALALRREHDDPASVWRVEVEIALAESLLAQGKRQAARNLIGDTRRALGGADDVPPRIVTALQLVDARVSERAVASGVPARSR